jgi:hypothetical protein
LLTIGIGFLLSWFQVFVFSCEGFVYGQRAIHQ